MALVIVAIIVIVVILIFGVGGRQLKKEQTVIPEKVGQKSYIDRSTGTIYLRSFDYETRGGKEWIVTDNSLTVKQNSSTASQIIPLSKIHTMTLDRKEHFGSLSYEILEKFQRNTGSDSAMTMKDVIEPVASAPIFFPIADIDIAQAICDRVASATN